MRLREREKRTVTLKPPATPENKYLANANLYRFDNEKAVQVRAVVQPLSGHTAAMIYGQTISQKLRMLYDGDETLAVGMGVCVEVATDAPCDYRIEDMPARWLAPQHGHWNAVLAYIPPEKRGP